MIVGFFDCTLNEDALEFLPSGTVVSPSCKKGMHFFILEAPIMTAADDIPKYFFIVFF